MSKFLQGGHMKNRSTLISIFVLSMFLLLFAPYQSLSQNKDTSETETATTNNYYLKTAKIYLEQKDYTKAVDALELAVLLEPNNEEALTLLKQSRQLLEETNKSPETPKKTGETREAKAAHAEDTSQLIQDAYTAIKQERYDDAAKIVEENKIKPEQLRLIPNPPEGPFPKVIEDALNTIISFEFLDTPLRDIVIFVREKSNINMIIDSEAGNVPVTLKLKDVPLRTALKYILPKGYEYVIEGDIIHFYKQKMEMRVYDVRDILINLDDKDPSARVLDLIELIVTTVEPSSWSRSTSVIGASAAGGQRSINIPGQGEGSIVARMGQPGDLVVVNNKYVHKQIEDLLASLRSSQNLQVSIEARIISVTDKYELRSSPGGFVKTLKKPTDLQF